LAIILPPAIYDLGQQFIYLNREFIDLIGSTNDRKNHWIKSNFSQPYYGVLTQDANNVKIMNLTIENTNSTYTLNGTIDDPSVYSPMDDLNLTYIENVEFISDPEHIFSTRTYAFYAGTYVNCVAGDFSFGTSGGANGIFKDCKGGSFSFGSLGESNGKFTNCEGGAGSFNLLI